jgi:hypothetical protein
VTVTIDIPKEIEAKLLSESLASGVALPQLVQGFLVEHYEEIADSQLAEARLADPMLPMNGEQLRESLGLKH